MEEVEKVFSVWRWASACRQSDIVNLKPFKRPRDIRGPRIVSGEDRLHFVLECFRMFGPIPPCFLWQRAATSSFLLVTAPSQ